MWCSRPRTSRRRSTSSPRTFRSTSPLLAVRKPTTCLSRWVCRSTRTTTSRSPSMPRWPPRSSRCLKTLGSRSPRITIRRSPLRKPVRSKRRRRLTRRPGTARQRSRFWLIPPRRVSTPVRLWVSLPALTVGSCRWPRVGCGSSTSRSRPTSMKVKVRAPCSRRRRPAGKRISRWPRRSVSGPRRSLRRLPGCSG